MPKIEQISHTNTPQSDCNANPIISLARQVIQIEADTLLELIPRIGDAFLKAVNLIQQTTGRIVVTGVGKSGHIAKKIAATLASTGSPAFFVHPSEAKHGDMGMLTSQDSVIAISYSGESEEILTLLPFIKRLGVPLISLSGKPQSRLAQSATVHLDVSVSKEACPLGLAPTSSTTAALVMGDALAMALLDLRGFTQNDFALTHPGGTLGKRLLLRVSEMMHQGNEMPVVSHQASLQDALIEMTKKKLGMTMIVNSNGQLIGIFTDGDIRRAMTKHNLLNPLSIESLMSPHPKTISPDMLAADALNLMEKHRITSLIAVNEDQHPIGIIHIHDILKAGIL